MTATDVRVPVRGAVVARARGRRARSATLAVVVLVLVAAALVAVSVSVGSGDVPVSAALRSLVRPGQDPAADFIVRELRLPRTVTSLLVGLALGIAGTVFQRLLRNPLASPDILGIASGAGTAAVAALVLADWSGAGTSVAALLGGLGTSLLVYLVAWRRGVSGYRFVLVGVGVAAFASSATSLLVAKAQVADARAAMLWLTGSSGLAGTPQILALGAGVLVGLPAAVWLQRRLVVLELGDDAAAGLGVRVEGSRRALLVVAVVLVALSTAAAGPIAFVALMAGPLARRLPGGSGVGAAALVGSLVMLLADLVGLHALPMTLPTGVVTGLVGAPYVAWLVLSANRRGAGG